MFFERQTMKGELVPLLKRLIRFKTVDGASDEIKACADWIEAWLVDAGLSVQRMEKNGVPSIWVTPEPEKSPVLLMAHFDVVAADDALFEPREEDGKLYGRGSCDDKYAVALGMIMVRDWVNRLKAQGRSQADLPFGILLTGDEEVGGYNGACAALKKISCDYCMALDGGSPHKLVVKEKGILRLTLVAKGKSFHGARPWLGENAIDTLVDDIVKLRAHFPDRRDDHWNRTVNVGRIEGGSAVNQVPGEARAYLDIRFTEEDDIDALMEALRADLTSEVEVLSVDPLFNGGTGPVTQFLSKLAGDIEMGFEHGGSDARFLSEHNTPGVVWGAQCNMSLHTENEHVEIDSIEHVHGLLNRFFEALDSGELTL